MACHRLQQLAHEGTTTLDDQESSPEFCEEPFFAGEEALDAVLAHRAARPTTAGRRFRCPMRRFILPGTSMKQGGGLDDLLGRFGRLVGIAFQVAEQVASAQASLRSL